ncbi:hypothetical protein CE91St44_00710 [Oscillospiraceae bacterium]|nr:hypothetical protein CE91St44_00710 [Oscillospiraceae bacterium]
MKYSVFTDADWIYPDSPHGGGDEVRLSAARGGHAGAQILGEAPAAPVRLRFAWRQSGGPRVQLYQLAPVGVNENTSPTLMTTTDYESCRAFVTRRAPFEVYDALRPVEEGLAEGRLALYLCAEAAPEQAPGVYTGELVIAEGAAETRVPVRCTVHSAQVPPLAAARFSMLNFFNYEGLAAQHGVEPGGEAYWQLFRQYVRAQLEMRCTHILLPPGEAVFQNGVLAGFDFSAAERAGRIALEEGAVKLCGGHVAHWHEWDDSEYYPNWDDSTGVSTPEGYLQMRLYFTRWAQIVRRNGWQGCMTQALADEPQTHNDGTYRILAGMFRKFLPGVPIIDAVETTNLGGGIDVWVPKQDTYEKWRGAYEALKAAGEEMWFYTCAFPAGPIMNRSMDLPLTASRAVLWMGALYRLTGFLHWGFNYYIGDDLRHSACCPHKGALLPAGDAHIVYPGPAGPWRSMRFEAQRAGAEECELLMQAAASAPTEADGIIRKVCTSFREYTRRGGELLSAREELFSLLESGVSRHG